MRKRWKKLSALLLGVVLAFETPCSVLAIGSENTIIVQSEDGKDASTETMTQKTAQQGEASAEEMSEAETKEVVDAAQSQEEVTTYTISVNGILYELSQQRVGFAATVTMADEAAVLEMISGNEGVLEIPVEVCDENGESYDITRINSVFYADEVTKLAFSEGIKSINPEFLVAADGYGGKENFEVSFPTTLEDVGTGFVVTTRRQRGLIWDGDTFESHRIAFVPNWLEKQANGNLVYAGKTLIYTPKNVSGRVEIQDGCVQIAEAVFMDNTNITSVFIPASVSNLGEELFSGCTNLTEVTFAENTTIGKIPYRMFCESGLTKFNIPKSVVNIGTNAFRKCENLKKVEFHTDANVVVMEFKAFAECKSLEMMEFPTSLKQILTSAFEDCTSLAKVSFGDAPSLEVLNYRAFRNCAKLNDFKLPDTVKRIEGQVFDGCIGLENFTIGEESALEYLGYQAFGWSPYYVTDAQTKGFSWQSGAANKSETGAPIKEIYLPKKVLEVDKNSIYNTNPITGLFAGNDALERVTIGNSEEPITTAISPAMFLECENLKEFHSQGNVNFISSYAFAGCNSLEHMNFENVYLIDAYSFADTAIRDVVISASVKEIGTSAFAHCKNLKSMKFQSNLLEEEPASYDSRMLKDIIGLIDGGMVSDSNSTGIVSAKDYANLYPLETCLTKVEVEMQEGKSVLDLVYWDAGFLSHIYSLEEVVLPEGIKTIPNGSFKMCYSLKNINLPVSIEEIGYEAFICVPGIDVDFSKLSNLKSIGEDAFKILGVKGEARPTDCTFSDAIENGGISNIILPEGIKSVGRAAFLGQRNVEKIVLPESLTDIGTEAFHFTNAIKEIDIQTSVSAFGVEAPATIYPYFLSGIFWNSKLHSEESDLEKITLHENFLSEGVEFGAGTFELLNAKTIDISSIATDTITERMFNGARRLTNFKIPASVETIGRCAFIDTMSLNSILLSEKVNVLEVEAFSGSSLEELFVYNRDMIFKDPVDASVSENAFDPETMTRCYSGKYFGDPDTKSYGECISVSSNVVIYGYADSTAQAYAEKHGNEFHLIDGHTVSFVTNGGTEVTEQTIRTGYTVLKPEDPTRDGFEFEGWFADEAFTNAYDFETKIKADVTLYAKWKKIATDPTPGTGNAPGTGSGTGNGTGNNSGTGTGTSTQTKPGAGSGQTTPEAKKPVLKLNVSKLKMKKGTNCSGIVATEILEGDKIVKWSSSNKNVVTVSKKGKLTAKKTGTATITVTTKLGAKAKIKVTVQKKAVKTTKLQVMNVANKKLSLKKGKKFTLKAQVTPISSTEKITYKSSNKKVATVSKSGKITAKKKGSATITVKSGKKSVKIKLKVK